LTTVPLPTPVESPPDLAARFAERLPPLRADEALLEANRCLYCYDAPCIRACPTHIDIPSFIKKIATDNLKGSARVIMEANVMGASCARVCPVEELCEGACVYNDVSAPIAIGRLQRHATDYLFEREIRLFEPGAPNGRSVAVVGAGPAGLSCAAALARAGCAVTVFDRQVAAGGLATYGIIPLREPVPVIRAEIGLVAELGVQFRQGVAIGQDIAMEELLAAYDAIFLAVGAGAHVHMPAIPGGDLPGVYDALDLISAVRTEPLDSVPIARRVAVIGAGNTGMDALTIARRLGAEKVTCVYRRSVAEITAYPSEYEFVKSEEVEFLWLTAPVRFVPGDDGRVAAMECVRMRLAEPDASGRRWPETVPGSEFLVPADMVFYATGQQREPGLFEALNLPHDGGRLLVDPETFGTAHPKVFAGGDCVSTGADLTVVAAVQQGKRAARSMLSQLGIGVGAGVV